jgi:hypothetical protein
VAGGGAAHAVQAGADPIARRAALALAAKQAVADKRPEEAAPLVIAATRDPDESTRQLALRLAAESVPAALMAPAYARAKERKSRGVVDVDALLREYPQAAHPLARRAIRSALGELDVMVPIPAGEFMMGESGNQHLVRVAAFGASVR